MLIVYPSSRFKRSFKKQPSYIKEDFAKKIEVFRMYPFHPSLGTHKLSGNLSCCYSFVLRDGFRVLFDFVEKDGVLLVNIGGHDDYRKWSR